MYGGGPLPPCCVFIQKRIKMRIFIRILLVVIGAFLVLDTIIVSQISNLNLGVIMPAVIGLPLLILGIFFEPLCAFFAWGVFGKIIKWAMIAVYALFTLLFITTTTLILVSASQTPARGADALIVLGAGIREDRVTLTLRNRLDTAYEYLCENPNTICIVSGGMGEGETVTEASVMSRYLIERGISAERIIEESRSESTYENFLFSNEIITQKFGENANVVFVTTGFHVFRAGLTAKTAGVTAQGIASRGVWYIALNDYMRECAAITQYFASGKI